MNYRETPAEVTGMPPGVAHIVANEAAERFSYYGMKSVLAVFMVSYLHLMDGGQTTPMSETQAAQRVHEFGVAVYFLPILGAVLSDVWLGKYRTIIALSLVYCLGHAALACMGFFGGSGWWLFAGLGMIALGSGGIKPCVSAHVGDQFGTRNAHLLPRVYNWFYFAINLGATASTLLTPWLLEWHGPHWAFGVPGVLMALATLVFWLGRKLFTHVPPVGLAGFLRGLFSGGGLAAILRLMPLYSFVAVFWALFEQTATTWVFQAQHMDRSFLGASWLPSQLQTLNSVFVLLFIPLFAYGVYPLVDRVWKLTPLRKIGAGLVMMAASFALIARIQGWIEAGQTPSIGWQVPAYALLTAAEVMVSIPALEFAYTQAPRAVKSLVMCLYLLSVALGNLLVAQVNQHIRTPDTAAIQLSQALTRLPPDWRASPRTIVLPGMDGQTGTLDDLVQHLVKGKPTALEVPGMSGLLAAASEIEARAATGFPGQAQGQQLVARHRDAWGRPLRYHAQSASSAVIVSDGPDASPGTRWDVGLALERPESEPPATASWTDGFRPTKTWLERHRSTKQGESIRDIRRTAFSGGQVKLRGSQYFLFFVKLMLATFALYLPYAWWYGRRHNRSRGA